MFNKTTNLKSFALTGLVFLLSAGLAFAQVNEFPYLQNFEDAEAGQLVNFEEGWDSTDSLTLQAVATANHTPGGSKSMRNSAEAGGELTSPVLDLSGQTNIAVNYWMRASDTPFVGSLEVYYSIDGGTNWTLLDEPEIIPDSKFYFYSHGDITAIQGESNVKFKWSFARTNGQISIDDIGFVIETGNLLPNYDFSGWTGSAVDANDLTGWSYTGTDSNITRSDDGLLSAYSAKFSPISTAYNLHTDPGISVSEGSYYSEIWIKPLDVDAENYVRIDLLTKRPNDGGTRTASFANYTEEIGWIKLSESESLLAGDQGGIAIRGQRQGTGSSFLVGAAWLGNTKPPAGWIPAQLKIASASYDLDNPANVSTTVDWMGATSITSIVDQESNTLTLDTDYKINGNEVQILSSYLASQLKSSGENLELEFIFDVGASSVFSVTATASVAPTLTSAETNTAGTVITLKFSKDMADPMENMQNLPIR